MTGKTHMAVGVASTLVVTKPQNITELTLCASIGAFGSLLCDIDVSTSKSHKIIEKLVTIGLFAGILTAYMEYSYQIGLIEMFCKDSDLVRLAIGILLFFSVCVFGKEQPHRSFMHSILALFLLSAIVYFIFPMATKYFVVAMASHIIVDLLNYKNVQLFYPFPGGISLHLCHSDGVIDSYVRFSATFICIMECLVFYHQLF